MLNLLLALQTNLLLGVIAAMLRVVSVPGMIAGVLLGTMVWHRAGRAGYVPFLAFCVIATVIARWRMGGAWPGRDAPVGRLRRATGTSLHCVGYCLMPSCFAAFWESFPDPTMCHVAVVAGCAAALAEVVVGGAPHGMSGSTGVPPVTNTGGTPVLPTVGANLGAASGKPQGTGLTGVIRGLAAGGLLAVAGYAAGAIGFWQVWIVVLSAGVGLAAGSLGRFAWSRLLGRGSRSAGAPHLEVVSALLATGAASLCAFAVAWVARS